MLIYIIFAQGVETGWRVEIGGLSIPVLPVFQLDKTEFIAVVTTTTAAVFGFLVIVARGLFKE